MNNKDYNYKKNIKNNNLKNILIELHDESEINNVYINEKDLKKYNLKSYCKLLSYGDRKTHNFESNPIIEKCDNNIIYFENFKNSFRIMTYNVHNFINLCENINPPKNFLSFFNLINKINSDIVCLQECVPIIEDNIYKQMEHNEIINQKLNYKYIVSKMKEIGYKYSFIIDSNKSYNLKNTNNNNINSINCYYPLANAIFSKIKLNNVKGYSLPGSRSFILCDFIYKQKKIILINCHLKYSHIDIKKNNTTKIKELQYKYLFKILNYEKKNRSINSVILCGDLNENINNINTLKKIFSFGKSGDYTSKFYKKKIDYILLNNDKEIEFLSENIIDTNYSDHYPVYTDVCLKNNTIDKNDYNYKLKKAIENINFSYFFYLYHEIYKDKNFIGINVSESFLNSLHYDNYWYYNNTIKPLINNDIYNYYKPLNEIYKKYKSKRFDNLSLIAKKLNDSKIIEQNNINDEIILYYCMTRPNIKTIIIWPNTKWYKINSNKLNHVEKLLNESGYIYYEKILYLNYFEAQGLLYQLYLTTERNKILSDLKYHSSAKGWDNKNMFEKYPIKIYFYEYKYNQTEITGTQAFFKNKLRKVFITNNKEIYNTLHINDFFSEAIDNCKLLLNENSIKMLSIQKIGNHLRIKKNRDIFMLNSLKKILFENFNQIQLISFVLFSSINLYIIGLRRFNDLDGIIMHSDYIMKNNSLKTYKKFFTIEGNSYLPFIDFELKGTIRYEDYLDNYHKYLSYMIGADNINDIILNPKYHYYFFGLKIPIIEFDIIKRMNRFRPKAISDLILYLDNTKMNFKIPKIPSEKRVYYNQGKTLKIEKVDKENFLKKVVYYLKSRDRKYSIKDINKYFSNIELPLDIDNINLEKLKKIYIKLGVIKNK